MKVINGIKMYSTRELCDLLGVSSASITAMRNKGLLLSTRIGKGKYTSEHSLADYLNGKTGEQGRKTE